MIPTDTNPRPRTYRRTRGEAALAALAATVTLILASCSNEPAAFAGYERTPVPEVGGLALPAVEPDGSEQQFQFQADDGQLLLVYFGYTSCPDVCPTTLSDLRQVSERLGDDAERLDLAMVTIDPGVDMPEVLAGYVRSFLPRATAIRTEDNDRLRAVADVFGADYGVNGEGDDREVYHTGSVYAVDQAGQLVLTWPFGTPVDDLESDLNRLLSEIGSPA